jgi:flavin reductase (DIM6/NTAB) family NADH-FMN oxidoreductase RutF
MDMSGSAMEVNSAAFKSALRGAAGVCSVITVGIGADLSGLVLTTAVPLSVDPPLIMACVNRTSSSFPLLERYRCFGWNSLGAGHQPVAERFSGFNGEKGAERYVGAEWDTAVTGARLLRGAPVACDCTVEEIIERATHAIVIGRVRALRATPGAGSLAYRDGRYLAQA